MCAPNCIFCFEKIFFFWCWDIPLETKTKTEKMIVGTSACYFSNLTKSKLAASRVDGNESRFLGSTTDPLKPYFRENGIVTTRTRAQRPEDLKTTERRRRVRTLLRTQPDHFRSVIQILLPATLETWQTRCVCWSSAA